MKKLILFVIFICLSVFIIPSVIIPASKLIAEGEPVSASIPSSETGDAITTASISEPYNITLYKTADNETVTLDFEEYISGIVAAEMPPTNHAEALKAQAVAARGFILGKIADYTEKGFPDSHNGAMLCDDFSHCKSWTALEETAAKWDNRFTEDYTEKIKSAVYDTKGEYLTYDNKVAKTFYHAVSHGNTESSADIWDVDRPYLKSVESSGDNRADGYKSRVFYPMDAFFTVLSGARPSIVKTDNTSTILSDITYTEGGSVATIILCGEVFKGTEISDMFKLRSSCFTITFEDSQAVFDVSGYGHGVGMSQFGANTMAEKGEDYKAILSHYYTNTVLSSLYHIA